MRLLKKFRPLVLALGLLPLAGCSLFSGHSADTTTPAVNEAAQDSGSATTNATDTSATSTADTQAQTDATQKATPSTSSSSSGFAQLTLEQADSARQALIQAYKAEHPTPTQRELNYVQPKNKKVACKFLFDKSLVAVKGAKVLWDGQCLEGYAHGVGRIIYRSANLDIDGITDADYQGKKLNYEMDFIHNKKEGTYLVSSYSYPNDWSGKTSSLNYFYVIKQGKLESFLVDQKITDGDYAYTFRQYPFYGIKALIVNQEGVVYSIINSETIPQSSVEAIAEKWFIADPKQPGTPVGVGYLRGYDKNLTAVVKFDGNNMSRVEVPQAYFDPFLKLIKEQESVAKEVKEADDKAKGIMGNYLLRVCTNGKVAVPAGLTKDDYTQICSLSHKLETYVQRAVPIKQAEMEQMKKTAAQQLEASRKAAGVTSSQTAPAAIDKK